MGRIAILFGAAVALAVGLASGLPGSVAQAKGSALGVSPDTGGIGTTVELFSQDWAPNQEVRLYAAFTTGLFTAYPNAGDFWGPIATAKSDDNGAWNARVRMSEALSDHVPTAPGFVVFRADSDTMPSSGAPALGESVNAAGFVFTMHGLRPSGSGEIDVSIKNGPDTNATLMLFGWRRVGESYFTTPYGLAPVPFDTRIRYLEDGDWEIAAIGTDGVEPFGSGTYDIGGTWLCLNPQCGSGAPILTVHRARRITIQHGEVVSTSLALAKNGNATNVGAAKQNPPSNPITEQAGSASQSRAGTMGLVIGAGTGFLLILAAGELIRRRSAT